MSKILVIPDVHLKPWMFKQAAQALETGEAERAVCLMDIPDNRSRLFDPVLYEETYDAAIDFQKKYPETLWCYGNHDLSYEWLQPESGFSFAAIDIVREKLDELKSVMPDEKSLTYIHRIDNVLFVHGGITQEFVRRCAYTADYDDIDAVIGTINSLGMREMWDESSPIWFRPQFYDEKMYREEDFLQVVGHTPVMKIEKTDNVLSCDLFSTYRTGEPIGTEEFLVIDTQTQEYRGIRKSE